MSLYYRENGKRYQPDFSEDNGDPIRTEQCHADACDINKILDKHQIKNVRAHMVEFPPEAYQEFEGVDLLTATARLRKAGEIFDALPSEVRNEFNNDPIAFVSYASDPANNDRLAELLPAIAKPGSYFPNPVKRGGQGAGAATAPSSLQTQPPQAAGAEGASAPEGASQGGEAAVPPVAST